MRAKSRELAINGGAPVRQVLLPYSRQMIDDADINAVVDAMRSPWLTTGPRVHEFEGNFAKWLGVPEAVAVSSGTAGLHTAMSAINVGAGDEVILPAITFVATANCVVYQGATPIFADVDDKTLLIDPNRVEDLITPRTKAIIAVDYAGHPCDYDALATIARRHGLVLIADACHSLGAQFRGRKVGSIADLTVFSFHPVKHITTGEGGMIVTGCADFAASMRVFRNHGITMDHSQRAEQGSWFYEMFTLGYNYRLTDFQCALGMSQLKKIEVWIARRQDIAHQYDCALARIDNIVPLRCRNDVSHAYHLYVIRLRVDRLRGSRAEYFKALHAEGIGVNVHYIPVHMHPFYRMRFGTRAGLCPVAETAYEEILSLPICPNMSNDDVEDVLFSVDKVVRAFEGNSGSYPHDIGQYQ